MSVNIRKENVWNWKTWYIENSCCKSLFAPGCKNISDAIVLFIALQHIAKRAFANNVNMTGAFACTVKCQNKINFVSDQNIVSVSCNLYFGYCHCNIGLVAVRKHCISVVLSCCTCGWGEGRQTFLENQNFISFLQVFKNFGKRYWPQRVCSQSHG